MSDNEKGPGRETPDREKQIEWATGRSKLDRYHLVREIRQELKDGREADGRTDEPLHIEIDPDTYPQLFDFPANRVLNIQENDLPHIVLTEHDLEMLFPEGVPDFSDYPNYD